MGGGLEKEALDYLTEMARSKEHPDEKDFACRLATYKKTLCFGSDRYRVALPFLRELVPSCVKTQRVRWLFRFSLQQLEHASCNYNQGGSETFLGSLCITEFVVRYAHRVSSGEASKLLQILTGKEVLCDSADTLLTEWASTDAYKLCIALIEFCTTVPVTAKTVESHNMVMNLFLSMNSSALYHSVVFNEKFRDLFTETILASDGLALFLSRLLEHVVDWNSGNFPSSSFLYHDGSKWFVPNVLNVFSGGRSRNSISCGDSLGRHSAQLLAVLLAYMRGTAHNAAVEFMKATKDNEPVSFKALLTAIANNLCVCPSLCIVLYIFFHDHPTFVYTTMTTCSKEVLDVVQRVLHLSYTASREVDYSCSPTSSAETITQGNIFSLMEKMEHFSYSFISFMTSTLMLLFSQDQVLNETMNDTLVEPFFRLEYPVGKISVSSLSFVVLSYGIGRAIKKKNETLATLFFPCLSNMAFFIYNIGHYASQKLVGLLVLLLRKIRHECERNVPADGIEDAKAKGSCTESGVGVKNDAVSQMYVRCLFSIAEVIEGILQGEDRCNDSLVYELLHKSEELKKDIVANSTCPHIAAAHKALSPLISIIEFYETECASVTSTRSSEDILVVIRRATRKRTGSSVCMQNHAQATGNQRSTGRAPLKVYEIPFIYKELPHSYDFFGPFFWSTVLNDAVYPGGLLWTTEVDGLDIFVRGNEKE